MPAYALTFAIDLGSSQGGHVSDMRAQLYDVNGTAQGSPITAGFSEPRVGSGRYLWNAATRIPDGFRGAVEIYRAADATNTAFLFAANPEEMVNLDVPVSTRAAAGTVEVAVQSPLRPDDQTITLVVGNDYNTAEGRQITFTDGGTWPSLTGATARLAIRDILTGTGVDITGTIANPGGSGGTQAVTFQPTAAQTGPLKVGDAHRYAVIFTLAAGRVVTPKIGDVITLGDPL